MKKTIYRGFVAYYRVSTDQQGISGLGLDAQKASVARYLAGKTLLAEFTEVESGKSHKNRPQLAAAIAECKRRRAQLIIAKLDRLARNVHFISGLMETAVDFVAVDLPQANKLTIHIMAAMAEHEREMISTRTKAALDAAKREIETKGFRVSRRSGREYSKHGNPRWQESQPKATAAHKADPISAELLATMRNLRKQGKTLRAIADELNGLGLRTARGSRWYAASISLALVRGR